jgi:thiol-disulfide isomerase/thioredoxin
MKTIAGTLAAVLFAGLVSTQPASVHSASNASLSPLVSARDWIGARPSAAALAGNVVVLDVFTVDCGNCQNVVPTLRALNASDRARGLRIVGVHAPETPPERSRPYVERSLAEQGITWPVAIDNAFALWNTYGVTAWPTELFFDRHGHFRTTIVGDSQDDRVRATVAELLAEH